jgi:hypothetical protein
METISLFIPSGNACRFTERRSSLLRQAGRSAEASLDGCALEPCERLRKDLRVELVKRPPEFGPGD